MLILVTGGAASGKSAVAEAIACRLGVQRLYIATLLPESREDLRRITRHRGQRAQKGFRTMECPIKLYNVRIPAGTEAVLLECLTTLAANEMFRPAGNYLYSPKDAILVGIDRLLEAVPHLVVVTGELFSDGAAFARETEEYIQMLTELNRGLAGKADVVIEVVCGIPLCHKGKGAFTE